MAVPSWLPRGVRRLLSRYPLDERVMALRDACLASAAAEGGRCDGPAVAVQCVEDPLYYGLFAALGAEFREQFGAGGELVVTHSFNHPGRGWWAALQRSSLLGLLVSSKWVRAFRDVIERVAYKSQSISPGADIADAQRSIPVWRRLRQSAGEFRLDIDGVPVGDLIVDTYLRFRPSPRFDASDPFVLSLIWQAHRDVRRARAYFRQRKPRLYLTSYSTYLQHGIAVRVALQEGVRVRSFGNFTTFGKPLTLQDWFHTADTRAYREQFDALDQQDERLAQAEQQLSVRLSGGIDAATSYMKVSAYAGAGETAPSDVKGGVVVFLHDFYDSPHVYADLVFQDFWSWATFTIETLQGSGVPFHLKPHPNQISLSNEVLVELNAAYPGLRWLSPRITNDQLAQAGMLCGVTVYGTVAHELAFLGLPTIACARHPHNAFGFCRTARTVGEYASLLREPALLPLPREEMRRQALAFYYMYNLHGPAAELELRAKFVAFWKTCQDPETPLPALLQTFEALRSLPAFKAFVSGLL